MPTSAIGTLRELRRPRDKLLDKDIGHEPSSAVEPDRLIATRQH
jgi:hypothetical protein